MKYCALLFVAFLGFSSCENAAKARLKEASDAVLVVHDQVMPKSEELMNLKAKIQQKITLDNASKPMGDSIIHVLDRADNAMSDWMSAYDPNEVQNDPPEKALAYFEFQKDKIEGVRKQIDESIAQANEFLVKASASTTTKP